MNCLFMLTRTVNGIHLKLQDIVISLIHLSKIISICLPVCYLFENGRHGIAFYQNNYFWNYRTSIIDPFTINNKEDANI